MDFWHEKPSKTTFRVTYFLEIKVSWNIQISKIERRFFLKIYFFDQNWTFSIVCICHPIWKSHFSLMIFRNPFKIAQSPTLMVDSLICEPFFANLAWRGWFLWWSHHLLLWLKSGTNYSSLIFLGLRDLFNFIKVWTKQMILCSHL